MDKLESSNVNDEVVLYEDKTQKDGIPKDNYSAPGKTNSGLSNPRTGDIAASKQIAILVELKGWEEKQINADLVRRLKCSEFAQCVAAFLAYYDENLVDKYNQFKQALTNLFFSNFVAGAVVVDCDEAMKQLLMEMMLEAIAEFAQGRALNFLRARALQFIDAMAK